MTISHFLTSLSMGHLFTQDYIAESIERIRKFANLARTMKLDVAVGFSGGKDSQVIYELCKIAQIDFKAYYNVSFESATTRKFIREHYPQVIWRKEHPYGFIENIYKGHGGLLPTSEIAYCCQDYKHNPKYVDDCSIIGVRRAESKGRSKRNVFESKNKTVAKKNKAVFSEYFEDFCSGYGTSGIIQLKPIVDWHDSDVWDFIHDHSLPMNPHYKEQTRVGCLVCPKANFTSNYHALMKHPRLIDAFIRAKLKGTDRMADYWYITSDNKDYTDDKFTTFVGG